MCLIWSVKVNKIRLDLSQRNMKNSMRYILNDVDNINQKNKKADMIFLDVKIPFDKLERSLIFNKSKMTFSETFS